MLSKIALTLTLATAIAAVAPGFVGTSFAQSSSNEMNCVTWASPC
jgi:hypothetical protein